jgi:hypothetical protein
MTNQKSKAAKAKPRTWKRLAVVNDLGGLHVLLCDWNQRDRAKEVLHHFPTRGSRIARVTITEDKPVAERH